MRVPPPKPLTPDQLRGMSTVPETANVVVFMSAQLLAQWLEGRSFSDPDIKHTRVVTLEAVVPVGTITIEGTVMPLVDLTFKETVHYVEGKEEAASSDGDSLAVPVQRPKPDLH